MFGYLAYPKAISAQHAVWLLDQQMLTDNAIMIPCLNWSSNYQRPCPDAIILGQNSFNCVDYLIENAFQVPRLSLKVLAIRIPVQLSRIPM